MRRKVNLFLNFIFQYEIFYWYFTAIMYIFCEGCQCQCNQLPGKTCSLNDLLDVEWDVKLYLLTHSHIL